MPGKGGLSQPGPIVTAIAHAAVTAVGGVGVAWGASQAIEWGLSLEVALVSLGLFAFVWGYIMREHTQAEYWLKTRGLITWWPGSWKLDGILDVLFPLTISIVILIITAALY